jgi:hypothetical protein
VARCERIFSLQFDRVFVEFCFAIPSSDVGA